jgi:tetratricopeptide (TPR) repeat protein
LHDPRVAARYRNRRWFIRCDGVESGTQLAAQIARAIGLQPSPDIEPAVLTSLSSGPATLALDNLETPWVADALQVEELMGLLSDVAGLALIVSLRGSERPGGVRWREPFRPQPLRLPAAREAFLAIAGREFEADAHLDELLAAVDCVPLAITLLAYQAQGEPSLDVLLRRWEKERTEMLQRAGGRDRLTNLELSYELSLNSLRMTEGALRLLRMLGMLPGGLALMDLEAVMPDGGDAAASVSRKNGLVLDEPGRIRLLAPLREYIRRKYPPRDEDRDRMISHYAGLASSLADQVGAEGGAEAAQRLSPEASNIEALVVLGLDGARYALCVQAAIAWANFIRFSGLGSARPTECAASAARAKDDFASWARCIERLGHIALRRSDHDEAKSRYEEALPLYRRVGDLLGEANCIKSLGNIALARSDHDGAKSRYEETLPLYRRVGAVLGEANCIKSLGDIALRRSDHDEAKSRYEEALPLYRRVGSVLGEANCIKSLGNIALARSDHDGAKSRYDEALALYQRIPEPYSIGWTHRRLARLASEETERSRHIEAARAAWLSINRPDLNRELEAEFGDPIDASE